MKIWKQPYTLEGLNNIGHNTMVDHLGIEFTEIGDDYIIARMPVDHRTVQPMRILHGGASVALAESMGSVAGALCLDDPSKQTIVGVEINANHLRSVREGGMVYAKASPVRLGRRIQVWNIEISDEKGRLTCVSRLTIMVVEIR
jgi:1,4-dihydroxy-2-naphthoyl-CoA hydrolase